MHIVHVVSGIWTHTGGPAEVIPKLCENLVHLGCKVTLLTLDGPHSEASLDCAKKGVDFRSYHVWGRCGIWYSPSLVSELKQLSRNCDVIHCHGLWSHPNWASGMVARNYRKPYVITPHGSLGKSNLERSRIKKLLSWNLFDKHNVKKASCIHIFTQNELPHIRGIGIQCPVCIIPNGAELWQLSGSENFLKDFPICADKNILLFLGRVHPTKGVVELLDAWKFLNQEFPQWHLVICGSIESEYIGVIEKKIKTHNLNGSVTFTGPLTGKMRLGAYAAAKAFVLPSYAEGFSTSILEAMASKLPVIYTHACNFPELAELGAGIVGQSGVETLIINLRKLMNMSPRERSKMGNSGYHIIKSQYSWQKIASKWCDLYAWLIGKQPKPNYVNTDNKKQ